MEEGLTLAVSTKGADDAKAKLQGVSDSLSGTGKATTDWSDKLTKAGLAIGAVGVGLTAYSKSATNSYVDYVKQVNNISRITGEAVDTTSRLQYVFQRSGVDAGDAAQVFGIFQKQIQKTNEAMKDGAANTADLQNKIEAAKIKIADLTAETKKNGDANGSNANQIQALNLQIDDYNKKLTEAATPLQKLGVATEDSTGKARAFSDILLDVADKFKAMPNGTEKTTTSMELFGKSGKNLIPVLNKGSDGIKELEAQADALGITLSGQNVEAVAKYTEAQKKLKDAHSEFTLAIGQTALPMWGKLADAQVWATEKLRDMPAPLKEAVGGVVAFGGPVATAVGGLAGFASNVSSIDFKKLGNGFIAPAKGAVALAEGAAKGVKWLSLNTAELALNGAKAVWTAGKWIVTQGAILAVRGATLLWAAAQWVLNAAMDANPIGLIVLAIVAVIAIIVLLWTHCETFRDIVTAVFKAVWGAIKFVWDWISQNWPLLLAILTGPIGIAVYLIVTHWETIKAAFALAWQFIQGVWSGVAGWFGGVWQGIVNVFAGVGGWFAGIFGAAVNAIRSAWGGITGFFQGIWNAIVSIFGSIGAAVGSTIVGAIKGVVNGILSGAEGIVNGFVNAINGVTGTINKIPGVNIGKIGALNLPRLAHGGIVKPTPGGTALVAGEAGKAEAVIPLDKLDSMLNGGGRGVTVQPGASLISVQVTGGGGNFSDSDAVDMAQKIVRALRAQGLTIDSMGALR